jgi:hypothetical protein
MQDQPSISPSQNIGVSSPSIMINQGSREGIIDVMFALDPKILDSAANTWYDSHMEDVGTVGNPKVEIIPNARDYKCPTCGAIKTREGNIGKTYLTCSGTTIKGHKAIHTIPQGWRPILKNAGFYWILGQIKAALNTNISTGNISVGQVDIARKWGIQDRQNYLGWYLAYSTLAVLAGQYRTYVSDDIIKNKQLANVFNVGFCTNFIISFTNNIVANSSKGKNMASVGRALDTHVSTQSESSTRLVYDNPYGTTSRPQEKKSIGDRLGDMLKF